MYELCDCGHFGGMSPNGLHESTFQKGHGQCNDCECKQFTWTKFCDANGKDLTDEQIKIEMAEVKKQRGITNDEL